MVAVVKKSYGVRNRWAVYIGFVTILLAFLLWFPTRVSLHVNDEPTYADSVPTQISFDVNDEPTTYYDDSALKNLTEQLMNAAKILRGEDHRLIQWDATEETAEAQHVVCPTYLRVAADQIVHHTFSSPFAKNSKNLLKEKDPLLYQLIQESLNVAIFCITDNPDNRQVFSVTEARNNSTIHNAVVKLLYVNELASLAAHLIYIATFANANNHAGFLRAQVVPALEHVLLQEEEDLVPVTVMWAAAALQNLAASYCTTRTSEIVGRCDWEWHMFEYPHQIPGFGLMVRGSVDVDGTPVRKAVLDSPQLVERLVQWSCQGPVRGRKSPQNPFPGKNAQAGSVDQHELSWNIVPWAATGALKNLALDMVACNYIQYTFNQSMACFCEMSRSKDWLERNKGEGALYHLSVETDPCWFDSKEDGKVLCVDRYFVDQWGGTCGGRKLGECDYRGNGSTTATSECCLCGGGDLFKIPP